MSARSWSRCAMQLANKVAVVTAAGGGGCGRAIARRLAREGCGVVVSDMDEGGARETVRQIEGEGGTAVPRRCDVSNEDDLKKLFDAAESQYGGVDVIVNNAGPAYEEAGPLEGWIETIEGSLLGTMRATLLAVEAL